MDDALILISKLREDATRVSSRLKAMSESQREARVYTEGSVWTVRDVLAHLLSAETAFLRLFREIQQGGKGVDEGFAIDGFNAQEQIRHEGMSWQELQESYETTRGKLIEFVATLTPPDLDKKGRHPFLGVTSLREMIKMIYIHDQTHLRDIRRALEAD